MDLLRGSSSSDHIDILLNTDFITDVLHLATSASSTPLPNRILSKIQLYAARVADAPLPQQ
ncbi:hypothetical protein EON66_02725 [archaeon]|nr:MAG: hypothetical protein EON66_02725 [archaeon]